MLTASPFTGNVFNRQLPARLRPVPAPLRAARNLNADLMRIVRGQAVGNWMLPSLASITPQYIETILRGALGGNHVQQWELFDLMEDTWPRLLKNLSEIKGAVAGMDWKLEAWAEDDMPPTDSALDRKRIISDAVWRMNPAADQDDNAFEQTVADLLDAWAKGTSVLEILWEHRSVGNLGEFALPNCTTWVHPRNYAWSPDGFIGLNLESDSAGAVFFGRSSTSRNVVRFPENKFLVAIAKAKSGPAMTSALLRPLAWWWCAANFSADWLMNLAQLFGIPFRWATYAQNADDSTVSQIGDLLANMGSNGYGAFPEGTNLNFLEAGKAAGQSPQADLIERADKNCDLLILGQTLTSDTGDSGAGGGSLALGKVHAGVRDQIIQSAANFVARVLNQQLIPAILKENFGDTDEAPYFCPEPQTQKDLNQTATLIQSAVSAGLAVPKKWAHAELNIPLPQAGEEIIERAAPQPAPFGGASGPASQTDPKSKDEDGSGEELKAARALTPDEQFIASIEAKVDPVLSLINRIADIKDDAMMAATLKQFIAESGTIQALITADVTRQQRALEVITANSLKQGLESKP